MNAPLNAHKKTEKPQVQSPYDAASEIENGPLVKLHQARWILLTLTLGLFWIVSQTDGEYWRVVAVLSVVVLVTMVMPRRRKVTRLRAKAEARRRSNEPTLHMKKLAAALPDPCFILDRRGIVRFANESGASIFGNVRAGDPISFRIRQPKLLSALDKVLEGGPIEKLEYVRKGAHEQVFETWVTPIHLGIDSQKLSRPDFTLLLFHDQTEQKNSERMRADFVANASHELRTPLASVIGFIETLQGPARGDAKAQDRFLSIMLDQSERMSRLISDLLSLSRIEMKAHVLPDTKVDLNKIIRNVVDALKPLADETSVTISLCKELETNTEGALPSRWVSGDRDELVQVFENLVENALKYGQDGGKVDIYCDQLVEPVDGKLYYAIRIRDYGPGIPPEHLPRLTERFYRIDVASSREQKGTGLGLAIVKHILTRHRGKLIIDSTAGEGATFQVRLPVMPAP